jgi:hypothetical protein
MLVLAHLSLTNKMSLVSLSSHRSEFKQRFGVSVSFLATHSGLLRWQDYNQMGEEIRPE